MFMPVLLPQLATMTPFKLAFADQCLGHSKTFQDYIFWKIVWPPQDPPPFPPLSQGTDPTPSQESGPEPTPEPTPFHGGPQHWNQPTWFHSPVPKKQDLRTTRNKTASLEVQDHVSNRCVFVKTHRLSLTWWIVSQRKLL